MAGAAGLGRRIWGSGIETVYLTGLGRAHVHIGNQRSALFQIVLVKHPFDRHRHEVGIPHVQSTIGEGQPAGLGKQMHSLDIERILAEIEVLEYAQDLPDG